VAAEVNTVPIRNCSKKGVYYCPHGETSEVVEHLLTQCQVRKGKELNDKTRSKMGFGCVSLWRNRDMSLAQEPLGECCSVEVQ
jgi:hypothetical protein